MDDETFWKLIESFDWDQTGDDDAVLEPALKALTRMTEPDISSFQNILAAKLYALDGRAWAKESGDHVWWGDPDQLSVDEFLYARCVVVANGLAFFRAVLNDPHEMPKNMEFESLLYLADAALQRKTGRDDAETEQPEVSFETFSNRAGWE